MENQKKESEKDYMYKIKVVISYLVIALVFLCFKTRIVSLFDVYILPLLDIEYNSTTNIIFAILSTLIFIPKLYQNYTYKKELSFLHIVSLIFILSSYLCIRCFLFKNTYNFIPYNWKIGYLDIIPTIVVLYLILQSYNYIYNWIQRKKNKSANDLFIADEPLTDSTNDLFGFADHANMIAEKIGLISSKTHFSLGILSEWGSGKSTYLNFLKKTLSGKKFIIVDFNPRHSFETKKIQEDFFNTLNNQLKNHNSIFSSLIVDYMKAMGIIGKNNSLNVLLNIYKVWNKDTEKQRLNKAIDALPNRVVVFIEDLDRLLAEEIIEVFKLIDGNASLNNIIFISAYDKQHINKILGEKYQHELSKFSDKFFSWEIYLPKEKYDKTLDYLLENLFNRIKIDPTSVDTFKVYFKSKQSIIEKHLQTIRDTKRFINAFVENYSYISEYVIFDDYFWLQLIKYKSPSTYWKLYHREYIEITANDFTKFKLKENTPSEPDANDILNLIFESSYRKEYNSINNTTAFDDYFRVNSQKIALKELRALIFDNHTPETFTNIDKWHIDNKLSTILEYFGTIKISEIDDLTNTLRYLDVLIYLSVNFNINVYNLILILFIKHSGNNNTTSTKDDDKYKKELENRLKGTVGKYPYMLLRQLLLNSFNDSELWEFTSIELLEIAKHYIEDYIKNKSNIKESLEIELLYCCIAKIEPSTRVIHLDPDICAKIKEYIINNPQFYIETFIRNGMSSSDKYWFLLACEPFWKQIFDTKSTMEEFIMSNELDGLRSIDLVRNFWRLYESNNYKPIEFNHQATTYNEIIEDGLRKECQQLDKLLRCKNKFDQIKANSNEFSEKAVDIRVTLRQINDIDLQISKRNEIMDEINKYIREIE